MAAHCCIGSPCWLCHPTHIAERGGFYDLGKLETALAQRDALVEALEAISRERELCPMTIEYIPTHAADIAREALTSLVEQVKEP